MKSKRLIAVAALSVAAALAGCAQLPPKVMPSPYTFWSINGSASQWISQVFNGHGATYILARQDAGILEVDASDGGRAFKRESVSMDGAYYTIPGVHEVIRLHLVGGHVVDVLNPNPSAAPVGPSVEAVQPPSSASQPTAVMTSQPSVPDKVHDKVTTAPLPPDSKTTIGQLFVASNAPIDAHVSNGIIGMRMSDLVAMLPDDWTVLQGSGIVLNTRISVYLNQTIPDAIKAACGQAHFACKVSPQKQTIIMEMSK